MKMKVTIFLSTWLLTCYCQNIDVIFEEINEKYAKFMAIAAELTWKYSTGPGTAELSHRSNEYQINMITWQQSTCQQLAEFLKLHLLNDVQKRQTYLLCRGPKYTYRESRIMDHLYDKLQNIYTTAEVCINVNKSISKDDPIAIEAAILDYLSNIKEFLQVTDVIPIAAKMAANSENGAETEVFCISGENEFEKMMKSSRNPSVLRWLWLVWREKMVPIKEAFMQQVRVENQGARRNGYSDIGATWRDELEVPNLRQLCRHLYSSIRPLYTLLHGVVRYYLRERYGDLVPERGPIPAHLLGNLWTQSWDPLIDLITPKTIDLDASLAKLNWTVEHMVKRVEDFYQSMGLPAMTPTFWRESVFENKSPDISCHGTAADLFKDGDYRLLYCAGTFMEDFYVLHHEFGHIHYYMAYADQPGLFRQGNSALHESIGDAIMYGVMTPQHLHRLGLVNDSILYIDTPEKSLDSTLKDESETNDNRLKNNDEVNANITHYEKDESIAVQESNEEMYFKTSDEQFERHWDLYGDGNSEDIYDEKDEDIELSTDEIMLLKQALNKIPHIPFALVIDEYRWKYFEGGIDKDDMNKEYWDLTLELQGIAPPGKRSEDYFDIAAKYHVPDNTPYIRYYLSSFLQHQIFEALCRAAIFGRRNMKARIPDNITPSRCDIYGSKAAGKLLKDFMSRGYSQHWKEILQSTTGNTDINSLALQRYYRPLYKVLTRIIKKKKIPLGW